MEVVRVVRERRDLEPVAVEHVTNGTDVDARDVDVRRPRIAAALASGGGPARDLEHLEALARRPGGDLLQRAARERGGEKSELHGSPATTGFVSDTSPSISIVTSSPGPEQALRIAEDADAGRRAREDEIAGLERRRLRHVRDDVVDAEDEVRGRRVLKHLAAHDRPDRERVRIGDLVTRRHRADGAERVRRLAARPLSVRELKVARAHVVRAEVAAHRLERVLLRDALDTSSRSRRRARPRSRPSSRSAGMTIDSPGPISDDGHFAKRSGSLGSSAPCSSA